MRKMLAKILIPDISKRIEREILIERKRCTRIAEREQYELKLALDDQRKRDLQEIGGRVKSLEREIHHYKQKIKKLYKREEKVKRDSSTLNYILAQYADIAKDKIMDNIEADRMLISLSNEAFMLVKRIEQQKD